MDLVHKFAISKKMLGLWQKIRFFLDLTLNEGVWGPFQQAKRISHGDLYAFGLQEKKQEG
jgi:hypothetical protein